MSCGEVMLVVMVIHDKGHLLAGRMNGKGISKLWPGQNATMQQGNINREGYINDVIVNAAYRPGSL